MLCSDSGFQLRQRWCSPYSASALSGTVTLQVACKLRIAWVPVGAELLWLQWVLVACCLLAAFVRHYRETVTLIALLLCPDCGC